MWFKWKILVGRTVWYCNFSIPCFKKNELLSPQNYILMVAVIQAASDLEEISREQSLVASSGRKKKQTSVHSTILLGQFKTKEMVLQASPLTTGTLALYVTIYLLWRQIYERKKNIYENQFWLWMHLGQRALEPGKVLWRCIAVCLPYL